MASQTFNLSGAGATESATVTLAAGERVLARFSAPTAGRVRVKAVYNGVTSYHPVNADGFTSASLLAGTVCSVQLDGQGASNAACAGIIETGT